MESPTPVSRYIPQNTKKRVFPGGSSPSGCKEVEVLEIAPPINRTSKSKSSKQKEVIGHEIIDVDFEDDCGDVMLIDAKVDRSGKGKEALHNFSAGLSTLANDGSPSDMQMSNNVTVDDFNSNLFYGEDEWIDTYYDDIIFDDYAIMESQFDHMDIPTGVEAPFPWLPSSPQNNKKVLETSTLSNSSSQHQQNHIDLSPGKSIQIRDLTTSLMDSKIDYKAGRQHMIGKTPSKWLDSGLVQKKSIYSSSKAPQNPQHSKYKKEPLFPFGKTKKRSRGPHVYSSPHNQFPSGATSMSSYPNFKLQTDVTGKGMPVWQDLPVHISEPSIIMDDSSFGPWIQDSANNHSGGPSIEDSERVEQGNVDEIVKNLSLFKKFDTVEDYSDHHFSKNGSSAKQPPKNWAKRIQDEWKILEKDLPDTIFVRVYESRMDLLRAVIVGAEGTPYHDGLFFFDVFLPSTYPNIPPQVHYHSGGLRMNPNLYNCGKVCLSLLNTWSGSHKEKWIPGVSTMLQVLVSIQGLILNAKPYFNEPGYANLSGSVSGEKRSLDYNERTFIHSLQTMVYTMRRPPKYFEAFVKGHFCKYARDILLSCKAYIGGAQVGCLVKGGVQDVDEGDKSCSKHFKTNLAGFITTLVNTFSQIGAKDCQEFLSLAQNTNGTAAAAAAAPSGAMKFCD